jgi:hypothetical protein
VHSLALFQPEIPNLHPKKIYLTAGGHSFGSKNFNYDRVLYEPAHAIWIKGTVSRDFRPLVFFVNRSPLGP